MLVREHLVIVEFRMKTLASKDGLQVAPAVTEPAKREASESLPSAERIISMISIRPGS